MGFASESLIKIFLELDGIAAIAENIHKNAIAFKFVFVRFSIRLSFLSHPGYRGIFFYAGFCL